MERASYADMFAEQVAQGMALGTGSALAHTAINSVFGSRHPDPVQVQQVSSNTA